MKIKTLLLLTLFNLSQFSFAQKEATWWYFGSNAGISFTGSGGGPVAQTNGKLVNSEGVSSISNARGGLLFYTDGETVYNKFHSTMINGTGLKGHNSSTQSALIVQQPVKNYRYYLFTTDQEWGSNGFQYSIIDTSLSGGNGQVVTKNIKLLNKCAEKVAAVRHANNTDVWIVAHSDTSFYTYRLSSKGIDTSFSTSIGPTWASTGSGAIGYSKGYLKFSPDGTKLIAAIAGYQTSSAQYQNNAGRIEIYDFNPLKGTISNPQIIDKSNIKSGVGNISSVYGVEFSPNGRFLYISFYMPSYSISGSDGNDGIWQLDLWAGNATAIGGSCLQVLSNSNPNPCSGMQLGPDGKIYIARANATNLSCIEKPNCKGSGCSFVDNAVSLSAKKSQYGIPNFISSYFNTGVTNLVINPATLCENSTTPLSISDSTGLDSVRWNFGDPQTGSLNNARGFKVSHKFSSAKTYSVFVQLFRKTSSSNCEADTFHTKLTIFAKPKPNIGRDTVLCQGQSVKLLLNILNATYVWNDNSTDSGYKAFNKGWHWVDAKVGACVARDSMYLDIIQYPKFSLGKDTTFCKADSVKLSASNGESYIWSNGKTSSFIFTKDTGKIWVKASNGKCSIYDTIQLKKAFITPNFSIDNPAQCYRNNLFNFKETTSYKNNSRKQSTWYFDDGSKVNDSITKRTFPKAQSYTIKLISQNMLGCKDSISKTVIVYNQTNVDFRINDSIQYLKDNNFDFINTTKDTGKINYAWNLGDKNSVNTKDVKGKTYAKDSIYKVKLVSTNSNNCKDSLIKTVKTLLNAIADFTVDDICEYDTAVFINKSTGATSYNWKFGDGKSSTKESPKHFYDPKTIDPGNVTLVAINTNGCSDSISKPIVINSAPISDYTYTASKNIWNFKAAQSGNTKYCWLFGDGDSALTTTASHSYKDGLSKHNVCLIVINAAGCFSQTCKQISTTGISYSKYSGFKIYPNPNSGNFTIEIDNPEKGISIEIFNAVGELVKKVERVEKVTAINLEGASGIYLVKVRNGEMVYCEKVSIFK